MKRLTKFVRMTGVGKKYCHETCVTGILKDTNSAPANLKETDVA